MISYDDLREVNAKLIDLKHTKEINNKLKTIVFHDSIIINDLQDDVNLLIKKNKKVKIQRNISIGTIFGIILVFLL